MEEKLIQNKKLKLLFLSLIQIDTLHDRGIYHDLLREFVNHGHKVTIVCPIERRTMKRTRLFHESGANILHVRTFNIQKASIGEKTISTLSLSIVFRFAIEKYLRDKSFDLILYSTPPITLTRLISFLKEKHKAKTYLLLKDIFPQNAVDLNMIRSGSFVYRYFRNLEKKLYSISDKIGCMSPANLKYILSHNPELIDRVEVNPNSLDLSKINDRKVKRIEILSKYNIPSNPFIFLYGGNLGKPQGVELLLNIIDYWRDNSKVYFLIIGDGTEFKKIENWFNLNLPSNAKIMQYLPKSLFDELAACCDIGMIFLRKEFTIPNFPSRLLTYLENKMPVIAITDTTSDIGEIAEKEGFGKWSIYGDENLINTHIKYFVNNPALITKMGNLGFDYMKNNYDVKASYNLIINSFKS